MHNGSERELVRRMLGGDVGAFDAFFEDYFPRLFRFALLRLRDPDAAEDIVQISLIAAVRHLSSWRGEATLFTWLCTICRREISAWEKRTSRGVIVSLAEDDPGLRAALEWKYLEELSVDDIAGRLQCTPKAAESLLTRARNAFRDAFAAVQAAGKKVLA